MRTRPWFVIFILVTLSAGAQQVENRYRLNSRATCSVPSPVINRAFKKTFVGVFDINGSVCYNFYEGLFAGGMGKAALLKIPPNKIPNLKTTMELYSTGGKIGYDLPAGNKAFLTLAVNGGITWTKFSAVNCFSPVDHPFNYKGKFIEPEMIINFFIENNFAIGINVSYFVSENSFDPYFLCLNDHKAYRDYELGGPTSYLDFGFGFFYGFSKRKKSGDGTNNPIKQ